MEKTTEQKAIEIAKLMQDGKGKDVTLIDISGLNSWADYFVIATVTSSTQQQGLSKQIKDYIKENKVVNADNLLSECELNLGHYDEAENITSESFLYAISSIINGNFIQIKVFLRKNQEKEALDLADWSINFAESVGKNKEVMLNVIYVLHFIKAMCQKSF